jgi:hypothetical protein
MQKTAMRLSPKQRTVVDPLHYEENQNGCLELSWAALVETAFTATCIQAITGTRWNGPRFFGLRDNRSAAVVP